MKHGLVTHASIQLFSTTASWTRCSYPLSPMQPVSPNRSLLYRRCSQRSDTSRAPPDHSDRNAVGHAASAISWLRPRFASNRQSSQKSGTCDANESIEPSILQAERLEVILAISPRLCITYIMPVRGAFALAARALAAAEGVGCGSHRSLRIRSAAA